MLETDAPFMHPNPKAAPTTSSNGHGGRNSNKKARCEPLHAVDVCLTVAQVLGRPPMDIAATTTANARRFFALEDAEARVAGSTTAAASSSSAAVNATGGGGGGGGGEGASASVNASASASVNASVNAGRKSGSKGTGKVQHVTGDCTVAQYGKGLKIVAHGCNDIGRWGKGFVLAVTKRFGGKPQRAYFEWHRDRNQPGSTFRLGGVQFVIQHEGPDRYVAVCNMITQHGIQRAGSTGKAPVRYDAIQEALGALGAHAAQHGASIHMPRIGAGLAGGDWNRILPLIEAMARNHGVDVYVYTL